MMLSSPSHPYVCFFMISMMNFFHAIVVSQPTDSNNSSAVISPVVSPTSTITSSVAPTTILLLPTSNNVLDTTLSPVPTFSPCEFVMNATNDPLFRNETEFGNITIPPNTSYVVPPPAIPDMFEYVSIDPINGVALQNMRDGGFVYKPDPSFIGIDTFEIDQCIFNIEDDSSCGDCRLVDIVIHVEPVPTNAPVIAFTTTNAPVVTPDSQRSHPHGQFGYVALAIIPILAFIWYMVRCCCMTHPSDKDGKSDVGTMIGLVVDTTHDDNRTVISGLHTISSLPHRQVPEQSPLHRGTAPRRLTPIFDSDIDRSIWSGSGTTTVTNTIAGSRNTSDQQSIIPHTNDTNNNSIAHNRAEDMTQMLNKIEQQQIPQQIPPPIPPPPSTPSSPEVVTATIRMVTPQAHPILITHESTLSDAWKHCNRDEEDHDHISTAPMVNAILISNHDDEHDMPEDTPTKPTAPATQSPNEEHPMSEHEMGNEDSVEERTVIAENEDV